MGTPTITARSGKRSRSAIDSLTSAYGIACSNCVSAVRKSGVSHSSRASSTDNSSTSATFWSLGAAGDRYALQPSDRRESETARFGPFRSYLKTKESLLLLGQDREMPAEPVLWRRDPDRIGRSDACHVQVEEAGVGTEVGVDRPADRVPVQ